MMTEKGSQQANQERVQILTPQERRERNRRETMEGILSASREVMREEGVGGLTLGAVSQRVGMAAPSLYNYFPSKMAIFEEIFARGMRQYRRGLEQIAEEYGPTAEGQRAAMEYFMTFAQQNPELFSLIFERPVPEFVPSEEGLAEIQGLMEFSSKLTESRKASGEIKPSIPLGQARDLFVVLMQGMTSLKMANEPELPVGEGRFGSLIPLAARALELLYGEGLPEESDRMDAEVD